MCLVCFCLRSRIGVSVLGLPMYAREKMLNESKASIRWAVLSTGAGLLSFRDYLFLSLRVKHVKELEDLYIDQ